MEKRGKGEKGKAEPTPNNEGRIASYTVAGAALSVVLLCLSFPPAGLSALAWCALVPLLLVLGRARGRKGLLILWLAGLVFGTFGFLWVRHVTWLGTGLLGFYLSVYFVAFCLSVRWMAERWGVPLALGAPLAWTALEFIRGFLLTGLPWVYLAHTQYKQLPLIQIADLTGTAGVTFWIVAVNGVIADGCVILKGTRAPKAVVALVAAAAVLLISIGAQVYGAYRLNTIVTKVGPSIAVVQGNIPQDVKNLSVASEPRERLRRMEGILMKHVELTRQAQGTSPPPDLIIWPETMVPPGLFDREYEAMSRQWMQLLAENQRYKELGDIEAELDLYAKWRDIVMERRQVSDLLLSAVRYSFPREQIELHNTIYFFRRGGPRAAETYDKIHLVPFGEYVPLPWLIGWLVGPLVPYETGLTPGDRCSVFETRSGWRFAPTVCFEDAFPGLVADFGRGQRKVDFIVNVTNEGWFKDGAELDEHLAIGVFRAIECRAGFVRAANTGISAFISPTGRILSKLVADGKDREVAGVLHGFATTAEGRSPYLAVGELFGRTCTVVWCSCMIALGVSGIRRRLGNRRESR